MKISKSILLILMMIIVCMTGCSESEQTKSLAKNYGLSDGAHALTIDEIVSSKSELCENLERAEFTITTYDNALDSDIAAELIYAEKDGMFIDICYGLSVEQVKEIFANYESTYEDFYLIAQNEVYVYAVSDEETFKTAGFNTLETNGILYIWE